MQNLSFCNGLLFPGSEACRVSQYLSLSLSLTLSFSTTQGPGGPSRAQEGTGRPREAQEASGRRRKAKDDPGRPRKVQRGPERPRQGQEDIKAWAASHLSPPTPRAFLSRPTS